MFLDPSQSSGTDRCLSPCSRFTIPWACLPVRVREREVCAPVRQDQMMQDALADLFDIYHPVSPHARHIPHVAYMYARNDARTCMHACTHARHTPAQMQGGLS